MSEKTESRNSGLFLIRLWASEKDEAEVPLGSMWHGRLLHVYSGEATSFDDWESLRQALEGEFQSSQVQPVSESIRASNE